MVQKEANFKQQIKYKPLRCDLSREIDFVAEKGGDDWITDKWGSESKRMTFLTGERCTDTKMNGWQAKQKGGMWMQGQRAQKRKSARNLCYRDMFLKTI